MKTLSIIVACLISLTALAGEPAVVTDFNAALAKAKAENKLLFMQLGRESCGNCQELRAMIKRSQVTLPEAKFVYADINCDDEQTDKLFSAQFKVEGNTLPFVVVASPDGKQLAARSGAGSAKDFEALISKAMKAVKSPN